jgi:light-regulated signal transduction histidine kinase (bacteriophytochrome)
VIYLADDRCLRVYGDDITDRIRVEQALRESEAILEQRVAELDAANKELEGFTYTVSHDLRAPLRAMDGFSTILRERLSASADEEVRKCLKMIRGGSRQMGRLIEDLLAFSRLGRQPLDKQRVDQQALVRAAIGALQKEQPAPKAKIEVRALPEAEGDARLLKQVWINLIGNALKYSAKREHPHIEIGAESEDGVPVYFVRDNGVGFDMRYANKLFGVFQRLHVSDDYEGTGIGLAIVQRIVGRHGGKVWAQAAADRGATFYFTLTQEDAQ